MGVLIDSKLILSCMKQTYSKDDVESLNERIYNEVIATKKVKDSINKLQYQVLAEEFDEQYYTYRQECDNKPMSETEFILAVLKERPIEELSKYTINETAYLLEDLTLRYINDSDLEE